MATKKTKFECRIDKVNLKAPKDGESREVMLTVCDLDVETIANLTSDKNGVAKAISGMKEAAAGGNAKMELPGKPGEYHLEIGIPKKATHKMQGVIKKLRLVCSGSEVTGEAQLKVSLTTRFGRFLVESLGADLVASMEPAQEEMFADE